MLFGFNGPWFIDGNPRIKYPIQKHPLIMGVSE